VLFAGLPIDDDDDDASSSTARSNARFGQQHNVHGKARARAQPPRNRRGTAVELRGPVCAAKGRAPRGGGARARPARAPLRRRGSDESGSACRRRISSLLHNEDVTVAAAIEVVR